MIDHLDTVIWRTLASAIPSLANRMGFGPPDQSWRAQISSQPGDWLNCALIDLREHRSRRTTGVRIEHDPAQRVLPPFLLRCHYLISAWTSGNENPPFAPLVSAAKTEHTLLGRVVAALLENGPLRPAAVLLPTEMAALPANWREATFDTELLPAEGFPKLAEFWQTMGTNSPWRPVIWLAVTVPVEPQPTLVDGIVTTVITSIGQGRTPDAEETLLTVGGVVVDAASEPVRDAMVTVTDAAGHLLGRATTDAEGRFVVDGLPPGTYQLAARVAGQPPGPPQAVTLPEPSLGPHTLQLT